jgi:hypothetical protein
MAFTFKLEHPSGTPAEPPPFRAAIPTWQSDTIYLGPRRTLRVSRLKSRG